jgi:acetyltransferase
MCAHDYDPANSIRFHGQPLRLRELRVDDRPRIEALLTQVAPGDLQLRFFGAFGRVPPGLLDQLLRIEPRDRLTVAAVLSSAGGHDAEILGVARAHRMGEHTAEAALLVRSDLKGQGLGTILLGRLTGRCREWGVSRMIIEVMRRNSRMVRLAEKFGFRCEGVQDDTCQLVLDLSAQP